MKLSLPPVINQGVIHRPDTCRLLCSYFTVGSGFALDVLPDNAMILLLIASPSSDDLVNRRALSGKAGASFFKHYVEPLGYTQAEVAVASLLRCRPAGNGGDKNAKGGQFPTGSAKTGAIQACRYYDRITGGKYGVIERFNPDLYILAQSLKSTYEEPAFTRLLKRDIAKAFDFAVKGYRPMVLMGNECIEAVFPVAIGNGGAKAWRGHWAEMPDGWPHLNAPAPVGPKGFGVAK
jgi:hypothetical protein